MRKSYLFLLPFLCGLQIVPASLPAAAYVYIYRPGVNEVEVDTSVLGDEPSPQDQEIVPSWQKKPSVPSAETVPAAPVAPVESAPVGKKMTKPFFATVPLEKPPVAHQRAHTPAKKRTAPRKLAAPVLTAPLPAPSAPSAVAAEPVAPSPVQSAAPVATSLSPPIKEVDVAPLEEKSAVTEKVKEDKAKAEDAAPAASLTAEEKQPLLPEAVAPATELPATAKAEPEKEALEEMAKAASDTAPVIVGPSDLTLEFEASSSTLSPQGQQRLDGMIKRLQDAAETRVQIRGFAKGDDSDPSSARRMSLARALSVRSYLMDKGIKPVRLDVRALGSATDRLPIDRVDLALER